MMGNHRKQRFVINVNRNFSPVPLHVEQSGREEGPRHGLIAFLVPKSDVLSFLDKL